MTDSAIHNTIAVVLAAGKSSRFGSSKQVAKLDGVSLIDRAVKVAAETCGDQVVVVAGADWRNVTARLAQQATFFVYNECYGDGIGSSISLAARISKKRADAMLLLLADQVLVTGAHLQALIDTWSGASTEIVASAYAGTIGPPVLLARGTFPDLCGLAGDVGAKTLLRDARFKTVSLPFEDAAIDIDTIDDLRSDDLKSDDLKSL